MFKSTKLRFLWSFPSLFPGEGWRHRHGADARLHLAHLQALCRGAAALSLKTCPYDPQDHKMAKWWNYHVKTDENTSRWPSMTHGSKQFSLTSSHCHRHRRLPLEATDASLRKMCQCFGLQVERTTEPHDGLMDEKDERVVYQFVFDACLFWSFVFRKGKIWHLIGKKSPRI